MNGRSERSDQDCTGAEDTSHPVNGYKIIMIRLVVTLNFELMTTM